MEIDKLFKNPTSVKKIIFLVCFLSILNPRNSEAQSKLNPCESGTLLIMGGNSTNDYFISEFAGLVGGVDKNIVIIPTAMADNGISSDPDFIRLKRPFEKIGFKNIKIVHTRNPEVSNTDSINSIILNADGVWISGGRQWRLADSYNDTKAVESLKTILSKGKVIAGTSAGASIMAKLLIRGDTRSNTTMLGDHQEGFAFLEGVAIDQHHLARNRQFDLFEIRRKFQDIIGIGLDENTGIIVNGGRFRVTGASYVGIYDGTRWSAERDTIYLLPPGQEQFYYLRQDQEYDIEKRSVILRNSRKENNCYYPNLESLVGVYQQVEGLNVGNDIRISVSIKNGSMYFNQSWNNVEYQVSYDYASTFFRPNANAVFHFKKDVNGFINQFKYTQNGSTTWLKIQ